MEKKKKLTFYIVSLAFVVSAFICLIVDYAVFKSFSWSLLVIGGLVLSLVTQIPFLLFKKPMIIIGITVFAIAAIPYLYLVEWFTKETWVTNFALPVLAVSYVFAIVTTWLYAHSKLKKDTATMIMLFLLIPLTAIIQLLVMANFSEEGSIINLIATPTALIIAIMVLGIRRVYVK